MSEEQMTQPESRPKSGPGSRGGKPRPRAHRGDGPIVTQTQAPDLEAAAQARAEELVLKHLTEDPDLADPSSRATELILAERAAGRSKPQAAVPTATPRGASSSIAEAMRKVKNRNAQRIAEEARINNDPELRQLKRSGVKVLPPTGARARIKRADPTVIHDGNGQPIGKPGYKIRCVPEINVMGTPGTGEITSHEKEGWVPVRYEHDDPEERFKKGEVVKDSFGIRMQMAPDEYAEYWASHHPTDGMDVQAYHNAQVQDIMERNGGSIVIQRGGRDMPASGVQEKYVSLPVGSE